MLKNLKSTLNICLVTKKKYCDCFLISMVLIELIYG